MERKGSTKLNISVSLLHQLVTGICALILPRFILTAFGSEANGLLQSVSQVLGYTTLMEMGIGGVVLASLYKPLAENNSFEISGIFNSTKSFFKKVSFIFVVFALVLSLVAKFFLKTEFDYGYVLAMVLILAVNVYFNYYFGLPHQLLLKADRRLYVVQSAQIVSTLLNLAVCVLAIHLGANLHVVKLSSAAVFLLNPLVYRSYVKKHYAIDKKAESKSLNQKKEALVHHLAYFIHRNTDVVIISLFSSLSAASVYSVYNAVILMIENLLNAISSAVAGTIGNILATKDKDLGSSFNLYEGVNTFLATAIFTVSAIVIVPFVKIYTSGVNDVEYIRPVFAFFILAAGFMYCVRIPYISLASTAGKYKETAFGAVGEVFLNLSLSLVLVKPLGLTGVAVGTFVAMSFRTGYIVWYMSKNIIKRPIGKFVLSFLLNVICGAVIILACHKLIQINASNLFELALYAAVISLVVFTVTAVLNILINFKEIRKVRIK